MCSHAVFDEPSLSTETDLPALVRCGSPIRPLLSVQFLIQPCPTPRGSLVPLSSISRRYGELLRRLWPRPEEGVALGVRLLELPVQLCLPSLLRQSCRRNHVLWG